MVDQTPDGGTCDLKNWVWNIGADPNKQYPSIVNDGRRNLTVVGDGAEIHVGPSTLRHRPALLVRGTNIKLLGDVTIVGDRPDRTRWDPSREAQHGVECAGATGFACTWTIRNVYGNALSAGKRMIQGQPDRWSTNLDLDLISTQIGRQHIAFDAADGIRMRLRGTDCVRSAVDVEPPGTRGGCRNLYWYDSDLRGHFTFAFANNGVGNSASCQHITLDGIRCHGTAFGARVVPPEGIRRQDYHLLNCWSDTQINHPPITVWQVDGIEVKNFTQPITAGVELVRTVNCTAVDTDCLTKSF